MRQNGSIPLLPGFRLRAIWYYDNYVAHVAVLQEGARRQREMDEWMRKTARHADMKTDRDRVQNQEDLFSFYPLFLSQH